jgi:hypothetical protein
VIADLPGVGGRADCLNHARAFVAADERQRTEERHVASGNVIIGVAKAGGRHPDQEFPLTGWFDVDFGNLPLAWLLVVTAARLFIPLSTFQTILRPSNI